MTFDPEQLAETAAVLQANPAMRDVLGLKPPEKLSDMTRDEQDRYHIEFGRRLLELSRIKAEQR